jgi:hypothetical protein
MGNWCTMTHIFSHSTPMMARAVLGGLRRAGERHRWLDPERWALRAGMLAPNVVLAQSLTKYGADIGLADLAIQHVADTRVVQICVGEDMMLGPRSGPGLMLGWNYVVSQRGHDLAAVAGTLGGGAQVIEAGTWQVLCLPEVAPLRLVRGRFAEAVMVDDGIGRLLYAFAAADAGAAGRRSSHVLGLYVEGIGFVHLLTLVLGLEGRRWEHTGYVDVADGAGLNAVNFELVTGPYAGSIYVETEPPVTLARARWPL